MHTFTIPTLILTHLPLQFIKTLDSLLFHITIICISRKKVEKSRNKITLYIFLILQKIHTTIRIGKLLHKFILLFFTEKKFNKKNIATFHVL
jgi:hypothetical protein